MHRIQADRRGTSVAGFLCVLVAGALFAGAGLACSTGDPDTRPADGGRIGRTTAKVDSSLDQAREHIRAIDSLGGSVE
jgi:hypothetical protein